MRGSNMGVGWDGNRGPNSTPPRKLTVKAATLIFISGRGSASSSAKQGKSGSIYNLVKN